MAQAPATPKSRRLAILTKARLGLPLSGLQASESAAISVRQRGRAPAPVSPQVQFLIPLVGRHHVGDWHSVERRLTATVESLVRQSNPNWRVTICGQDRPDLPTDPRIAWLPFEATVEGNDKWAKLGHLCAAVQARAAPENYVMPFDADDILAPWVVEYMLTHRSPNGYLVTRGYVFDATTGGLAEAQPQSWRNLGQKAFWKLCGSCAAFRVDQATLETDVAFLRGAVAHEHRMFPYLARLAGHPLTPLPGPSVLYIVNHGENFGVRRGRTGFKTRFVTRFPVSDPTIRAQAAEDFAIVPAEIE